VANLLLQNKKSVHKKVGQFEVSRIMKD